jgi:molybdenum cofactor biosynthesis protein B
MVDFQSRDTRRSVDDEAEEEAPPDDEAEEADAPDADEDGAEEEHEHGHDHDEAHDHHHHDLDELGTAVLTVSSSRSLDDDPAGDVIEATMDEQGAVVVRELVPDDLDRIQDTVARFAERGDVDVVVTTGGTGVTPDDCTVEAVRPLFDKELPGFGELFRILSHDDVGTRVVGTRATAGIVSIEDGAVPTFCLPGSEDAARLGVERIVSEEAGHLAGLASR